VFSFIAILNLILLYIYACVKLRCITVDPAQQKLAQFSVCVRARARARVCV